MRRLEKRSSFAPGDSPEASRDFSLFTGGTTGGLGWWWHTPEDTLDKVAPESLATVGAVILEALPAIEVELQRRSR